MQPSIKIPARFVYELKPGEKWMFFGECLIVVHPDRLPKLIHPDGREEEIRP